MQNRLGIDVTDEERLWLNTLSQNEVIKFYVTILKKSRGETHMDYIYTLEEIMALIDLRPLQHTPQCGGIVEDTSKYKTGLMQI